VAEYLDAYGLNFVERVGGTDKSKAVELCLSCDREWSTKPLYSHKTVILPKLKFVSVRELTSYTRSCKRQRLVTVDSNNNCELLIASLDQEMQAISVQDQEL